MFKLQRNCLLLNIFICNWQLYQWKTMAQKTDSLQLIFNLIGQQNDVNLLCVIVIRVTNEVVKFFCATCTSIKAFACLWHKFACLNYASCLFLFLLLLLEDCFFYYLPLDSLSSFNWFKIENNVILGFFSSSQNIMLMFKNKYREWMILHFFSIAAHHIKEWTHTVIENCHIIRIYGRWTWMIQLSEFKFGTMFAIFPSFVCFKQKRN